MALRTLNPRIAAIPSRLQALKGRPGTVERKRGSAGVKDRNRIRQRDHGLCQLCQTEGRVTLGAVVDHKVPLWAGGSDDDDNKWLICQPHHDEKTAREAAERGRGGINVWGLWPWTPHVNPRAENIPLFKLIQMNTPRNQAGERSISPMTP